jgi:putative transposase
MKGNIINTSYNKVIIMFQDEAGFGRINKPKYCWCMGKTRPRVPCQHIREYRYAYGAVSPMNGESFFLVLPKANTECMNIFLEELSKAYPDAMILLIIDNASWHRSNTLNIPENIQMLPLPPYTPELNPIEYIWKEIRKRGFKNEIFKTLNEVVDRLCDTICSLSHETIKSITGRDWLPSLK